MPKQPKNVPAPKSSPPKVNAKPSGGGRVGPGIVRHPHPRGNKSK